MINIDPTVAFVIACLLPSCSIAWIGGLMVRRYAPRWGLIDHPGARKVHATATPLGGGIAIWLGVIVPFFIGYTVLWWVMSDPDAAARVTRWIPASLAAHLPGVWQRSSSLWIMLGAGTVLMLVGLADDRWKLGWQFRLALQIIVATVCVLWQSWRATAFIHGPVLTDILSILWIVTIINSFNMLDNMDGLSGGIAAIAATMLPAVMLLSREPSSGDPQYFVGGFLLVVAGAIVGFLFHNIPPARIFMGDAGSYFIGFCIAIATLLATYTGYRSDRPHAVLAPIFVMAVPLYDMVTVLWIRIREGRSPFQADKNHFSHRLVDLGLTNGQAVLTIYLLTTTCGLGALLLHRVEEVGAVIIVLLIACVLALIAILETTARRRIQQ